MAAPYEHVGKVTPCNSGTGDSEFQRGQLKMGLVSFIILVAFGIALCHAVAHVLVVRRVPRRVRVDGSGLALGTLMRKAVGTTCRAFADQVFHAFNPWCNFIDSSRVKLNVPCCFSSAPRTFSTVLFMDFSATLKFSAVTIIL